MITNNTIPQSCITWRSQNIYTQRQNRSIDEWNFFSYVWQGICNVAHTWSHSLKSARPLGTSTEIIARHATVKRKRIELISDTVNLRAYIRYSKSPWITSECKQSQIYSSSNKIVAISTLRSTKGMTGKGGKGAVTNELTSSGFPREANSVLSTATCILPYISEQQVPSTTSF